MAGHRQAAINFDRSVMKLPFTTIILLFSITACSSPSNRSTLLCGQDQDIPLRKSKIETSKISLPIRSSHPVFYLPTAESKYIRYVIAVNPEKFTLQLQKHINDWHVEKDNELLNLIKKDMPLSADTDLLKYAFGDLNLLGRAEFALAAMLESGDASLIDLYGSKSNKELSNIQISKVENDYGESRYYCNQYGFPFFHVVDAIYD